MVLLGLVLLSSVGTSVTAILFSYRLQEAFPADALYVVVQQVDTLTSTVEDLSGRVENIHSSLERYEWPPPRAAKVGD